MSDNEFEACPECSGSMIERGDGLKCFDCGWFGVPCIDCGGWITEYVGVINGDSVSKCPMCGNRYYAIAVAGDRLQTDIKHEP